MHMSKAQGKLIAIEGLDGAGSTTQTTRLASWLKRQGYNAVPTKEPTGGPAGSLIRLALTERLDIDKKTLAVLFVTDRMDHLYRARDGIVELLRDPRTAVISDRYYLSSLAYQALEPDIDIDWLMRVHAKCLAPALTLFIDVPPEVCIQRIAVNRGLHFELFERRVQLERVRGNYMTAIELLLRNGENIQIVDGEGTPEQVEARIRIRVRPLLAPGYISPNERTAILNNHKVLAAFKDSILAAHLQIVHVRPLPHGCQVKVSDSGDVVIPVNFYDSGRVDVQGAEDSLKRIVQRLVREVAHAMPDSTTVTSETAESDPYVQEPLFEGVGRTNHGPRVDPLWE